MLIYQKKQPQNVHGESIKFITLGTFHDDFFIRSDSKYKDKQILKSNEHITIYTLRTVSSTSHNLEKIIKEKRVTNVEIKNATFSTIYEKMQTEDIIAYITGDYIEDDLRSGRLLRLDTDIPAYELEYGVYYNVNNKLKNIRKLFEDIK